MPPTAQPELPGKVINRRLLRLPRQNPAPATQEPPAPAPAVGEVLDEALSEEDLRIAIRVQVKGLPAGLLTLNFGKVLYDAFELEGAALACRSLERLFEETYQNIAVKLNTALPIRLPPAEDEQSHPNGKPPLFTTPIPPYPEDRDVADETTGSRLAVSSFETDGNQH